MHETKDPLDPARQSPPSAGGPHRSMRGVWRWAIPTLLLVVGIVSVAFVRTRSATAGAATAPGGRSTEDILREQGSDCLPCAQRNGCFDPAQLGGTCESTKGSGTTCGTAATETAICLKTLDDIFSSRCAATMQLTPCLCGSTDPAACLSGAAAPAGPVYADYGCDFKSTSGMKIQGAFTDQLFGAGQANALVQCVAAYSCGCFGQRSP